MSARIGRIVLISILAGAALPASAQGYIGAAAGQSRASFRGPGTDSQLLDLGFDGAQTSVDRTDTLYRLYAGWRLHRYVSIEAAYVDLGRFRSESAVLPAGTLSARTRTDGAEANVVGWWPVVERLQLMARAGLYAARTRTDYTGTGSVLLVDGASRQSRHSTRPVYGVGLAYAVTQPLALRAEWARYTKLGNDLTGGEFDDRAWTIGVEWRY